MIIVSTQLFQQEHKIELEFAELHQGSIFNNENVA